MLGNLLQEFCAGFGSKASDQDFLNLIMQSFNVLRMIIPQTIDADSPNNVDRPIAIDVSDCIALAFFHNNSSH